MYDFLKKKIEGAKKFQTVLLVLLIALVIGIITVIIISQYEFQLAPFIVVMILFLSLWILGVVYYAKYFDMVSNIKWLERNKLQNIGDDINLDKPTLSRSDIYCGQNAFFAKKHRVIVPYAQIAWVYLYVRTTYGVTTEKAVTIFTKDGKKFMLFADENEFQWLMANVIIKHSPDLIVGFNAEKKKLYKQRYPKTRNN